MRRRADIGPTSRYLESAAAGVDLREVAIEKFGQFGDVMRSARLGHHGLPELGCATGAAARQELARG
jgi:hypothetical protein